MCFCLLVSTSYTTKKPVDIEKAMSHPLPVYHYRYALQIGLGAKVSIASCMMHQRVNLLLFQNLPKSELLQTYFLARIAFIRTIIRTEFWVRVLLQSLKDQYILWLGKL